MTNKNLKVGQKIQKKYRIQKGHGGTELRREQPRNTGVKKGK